MLLFLQDNWGTIVASLAVAFFVFLAIRRMVLDKKAGIGACGQKCSECAKMGHCESQIDEEPKGSICGGNCASCKYSANCKH